MAVRREITIKSLSLREILWLMCAGIVPLTILPYAHNAVEMPKVLLLQILVLILVVATVTDENLPRVWRVAQYRQLAWIVVFYLCSLVMSTLFSSSIYISVFGDYENQQGLLTQLCYLLLFLCAVWGIQTPEQHTRLFNFLILGSIPVVAIGVIQILAPKPTHILFDNASLIRATLGHRNAFGSYLALMIPMTTFRVLWGLRNISSAHMESRRRTWGFVILLACQVTCLIATQAYGSWIGLTIAAIFLFVNILRNTRQPRLVLAWALIITILLISGFILQSMLPGSNGVDAVFSNIRDSLKPGEGSIAARLTIWQTTLRLISQHPIFGYGPGTFPVTFTRNYPPRLVYFPGKHNVVDNNGNIWLDCVYSTGFLGLCAGIALWLTIVRPLILPSQNQTPAVQKLRYASLGGALIGHLIEQQVSSATTTTSTVVWLIAVLLVSGVLPAVSRPSPVKQNTLRVVHIAIYIMAAAFILLTVIQPLRADIAYDASQDWSKSEITRFDAAERAVRYFPLQSEYWQGLAVASAHAGDLITAHNAIDKALSLEPDNPHIHALWGDLLTGVLYHIPGTLNQAINTYQIAAQMAPTVAGYQTSLGIVYARQGNLRMSRVALEQAVVLDPTEPIAFTSLASTYEALGETELAQRTRELADNFLDKR